MNLDKQCNFPFKIKKSISSKNNLTYVPVGVTALLWKDRPITSYKQQKAKEIVFEINN